MMVLKRNYRQNDLHNVKFLLQFRLREGEGSGDCFKVAQRKFSFFVNFRPDGRAIGRTRATRMNSNATTEPAFTSRGFAIKISIARMGRMKPTVSFFRHFLSFFFHRWDLKKVTTV